ncbi:putative leucine-rich repeat-containing, plant-type, leucine-rich repeat domain superfamily [Helianthus annuus]|uniref:Leucine-rich repeat-containing, plant-type, leucine-rich repeat domain superfamily n=1 Tax=Helianthus annuus TaxID=4232 RepID=A0A251S3G2_HELAN|nr:receptor-like protein 31 [Helianthus annuus]KAF5762379.1 putative leucine-rich repeat-containing, plant-type, leucine-rich repeat domain superfamily [Helianthus annuus]KAJ0440115.1 putative leucine-rich repeat-containing, plant-type, leucine-rich repeat domain superfamily [Helianthus annuus]KAJ0445412.1 putative leucine-rich repeat-containing, plant-type, leucine-rich repeat domain superfamily [Helianthus annuus]KAJ0462497.1 putative leucine-rich repeat-containing, plant-type, leucine-rich r
MEIYTLSLIFLSLILPPLPSQACHHIDHQSLLDFKHKITFDPSNLLQSWTPQTDCCKSWNGIACNSAGRVINLTRSGLVSGDDFILDTSMSGTLSPSLSNLTFLQLLDLSNLKDLSGPIPPQFGKLSRLTHLFLDSNKFSGSIPVTFRSLSRLQKLYLSNNMFNGEIPSVVSNSNGGVN